MLLKFLKQRTNRFFILIFSASVAIFSVIASVFIIKGAAEEIKEKIVSAFESGLSRNIYYGKIDPFFINSITIRDIVFTNDSGRIFASGEKLKISFNIFDFLFKHESIISKVYLKNGILNFLQNEDMDFVDYIDGLVEKSKKNPNKRNLRRFVFYGRNIAVGIDSEYGNVKLKKLFTDIVVYPDKYEFDGVAFLNGYDMRRMFKITKFSAKTVFNGSSARRKVEGDVNFTVSDFTSDFVKISKQAFHAEYDSEKIALIKIGDSIPVDYSILMDLKKKNIEFKSLFKKFLFLKSVEFCGDYGKYNRYLPSSVTGNFDFIYVVGIPESFAYSGDMSASFSGTSVPFEPYCRSAFKGNRDVLSLSSFTGKSSRGDIFYDGDLFLKDITGKGILRLSSMEVADGLFIDALYDVKRSGLGMELYSENFMLNNYFFGSNLIKSGKRFSFLSFDIFGRDGRDKDRVSFMIERKFSPDGKKNLTGSLRTYEFDISHIYNVIKGDNEIKNGNFCLDSDVFFIYNYKNLYISGRNLKISDKKDRNNFMLFSMNSTLDDFSLHDVVLRYNGVVGKGLFNISDMRKKRSSLECFWKINDTDYDLSGFYKKGKNLYASGRYDTVVSAFFEREGVVFRISAFDFPLYLDKDLISFADLDITGVSAPKKPAHVVFNDCSVRKLKFLKGKNSITFSGMLLGNSLRITNCRLNDLYSEIAGTGEIFFDSRTSFVGWVKGAGSKNDEEYFSYFDFKDRNINLDLKFKNSNAERFVDFPVTGNISGDATVSGTFDDPHILASASLSSGTFLKDPFEFDISFDLTKKNSSVSSLSGRIGKVDILKGAGVIDRERHGYDFESDIVFYPDHIFAKDAGVDAKISLSGKIDEDGEWILNLVSEKNRGNLKLSAKEAVLFGYDKWEFDYLNDGNRFCVVGGPFPDSVSGEYLRDGKFSFIFKNSFFLSGNLNGTLSNGYIDAVMSDYSINLGSLGQIVRNDFFSPLSGIGKGAVRIKGNVNNPEFWGRIAVSDMYSSVNVLPDIIGPSSCDVFLQGNKISVQPFQMESKGSYLGFIKADFIIEHWFPEYFTVSVFVSDGMKKKLKVKSTFAGMDVDGYATGNIDISGSGKTIWIEGDITIDDCIVNIGEKNKPKEAGQYEYMIDLNLKSGTGVEFYWPTQELPILKAYAAKNQEIALLYDSSDKVFSLNGQVNFRGGNIFYFNNSFFIKEGNLVFDENQNKFDPLVTINAEMRAITAKNEKVKIILRQENSPLSNFSPRIDSVPSLSQFELYEILGQTVTGISRNDESSGVSALLNAGSYGIQLIGLFRPLEKAVKDALNLDLFSIQAHMGGNVFNNRKNSRKSNVNIKQISSNAYFKNIDIFMGKYFDKYFFLDGSLRFSVWDFDTFEYYDYDMPNFFNMYLEGEINFEADTPLFILNLGLYPKFGNLRDSLLDTTIGLSWRFTF